MLVYSMDFSTWILLCPLILIVDICKAISTKICLICEEHWWDKCGLTVSLKIDKQKISTVDIQQALEPAHVANITVTAAVNGVPCKR